MPGLALLHVICFLMQLAGEQELLPSPSDRLRSMFGVFANDAESFGLCSALLLAVAGLSDEMFPQSPACI
jgi:hypothetical protein